MSNRPTKDAVLRVLQPLTCRRAAQTFGPDDEAPRVTATSNGSGQWSVQVRACRAQTGLSLHRAADAVQQGLKLFPA